MTWIIAAAAIAKIALRRCRGVDSLEGNVFQATIGWHPGKVPSAPDYLTLL